MIKERLDIVSGIMYGVILLKLPVGKSLESAIVFYGQDEDITLEEAKEVVAGYTEELRGDLVNILQKRVFSGGCKVKEFQKVA